MTEIKLCVTGNSDGATDIPLCSMD